MQDGYCLNRPGKSHKDHDLYFQPYTENSNKGNTAGEMDYHFQMCKTCLHTCHTARVSNLSSFDIEFKNDFSPTTKPGNFCIYFPICPLSDEYRFLVDLTALCHLQELLTIKWHEIMFINVAWQWFSSAALAYMKTGSLFRHSPEETEKNHEKRQWEQLHSHYLCVQNISVKKLPVQTLHLLAHRPINELLSLFWW
jgi:hypothetical protein